MCNGTHAGNSWTLYVREDADDEARGLQIYAGSNVEADGGDGDGALLLSRAGVQWRDGGKPILKVQIDGHVFWVKNLMTAGGCSWDETIVKVPFEDADAQKIVQIKSLNPRTNDQWKCLFLSKGSFSVRNAYALLMKGKICNKNQAKSSKMAGRNRGARMRCWQLQVMGKIKHFVWRCISNILTVNCNLARRGMEIDKLCHVCGKCEKTQEHTLFLCKRAQTTWKLAPVQMEQSFRGALELERMVVVE
ncbi:Unknown protein [Striga hermonthica]|uniref:Reverse transcriptase zinc-binding domain-containing protein n=1 Tax=Striga hermonthica TaxID=68872 RepID=A0A9N7MIM2_STRHE|nr:Unknown protein [Striga hermonthica]